MIDDNQLHAAINKFYDAGLGLGTWQSAVDYLNVLMPSVAFAIYGQDVNRRASLGTVFSGFDPQAMADFNTYYASVNVWGEGFARSALGTLLHSDDFLPREDLFKTEYYNDWLVKQEDQVAGWGSLLRNEQGRFLALSSTMRARDEDGVNPGLRRLIQSIMPHVDRAVQLARVAGGPAIRSDLETVVGQIPDAAYILTGRGGLFCMNEAGRLALSRSGFFKPGGISLSFEKVEANIWLKGALSAFRRGEYQAGHNVLGINSRTGDYAECGLWPLAEARAHPAPISEFIEDIPVGLLVLRPATRDVLVDLKRRYSLTDSELEIANMLVGGKSLIDIGRHRGRSVHTVRNQLRSLYEKIGVRRQSELVARILKHGRSGE